MVDGVDLLPVPLRLGRRVLVVQNQAAGGSRPPLEVEVLLLGPLAVRESAVDGVQRLLLDLEGNFGISISKTSNPKMAPRHPLLSLKLVQKLLLV